jgi:hypothetical protein
MDFSASLFGYGVHGAIGRLQVKSGQVVLVAGVSDQFCLDRLVWNPSGRAGGGHNDDQQVGENLFHFACGWRLLGGGDPAKSSQNNAERNGAVISNVR